MVKNANVETRYYTPTKKTAAKMWSLAWTSGQDRSRRKVVGAAHRRTERGHRTRCDSMSERPQEIVYDLSSWIGLSHRDTTAAMASTRSGGQKRV